MHTGPLGVNTFLVPLSETEVAVVDPADCLFSHDEGSVVSFLKSKNRVPVAVILTHGHFDHVSGLPSLVKNFPKIPIAIHKADSAMIGSNSEAVQSQDLEQVGYLQFLPSVSNLPNPTHFLSDKLTLAQVFDNIDCSDEAKRSLACWEVLHTPGHTEGSCCLYNEEDLTLISGDTLFYRSWGRTDLLGGSERKIHASLMKINEYCENETRVYPGHDYTGFTLLENY